MRRQVRRHGGRHSPGSRDLPRLEVPDRHRRRATQEGGDSALPRRRQVAVETDAGDHHAPSDSGKGAERRQQAAEGTHVTAEEPAAADHDAPMPNECQWRLGDPDAPHLVHGLGAPGGRARRPSRRGGRAWASRPARIASSPHVAVAIRPLRRAPGREDHGTWYPNRGRRLRDSCRSLAARWNRGASSRGDWACIEQPPSRGRTAVGYTVRG